jgi:hypothetical protein
LPTVVAQSGPDSATALGRLNWGVDEQNQSWTVSSLRAYVAAQPNDDLSREAGDRNYDIAPWDPSRARQLLRLARGQYPAIQDWTVSVVDESYAPRLKQLAAMYRLPPPSDPA